MTALVFNRKRLIAFSLSLLLIMQQSLTYQALASIITNGDGSLIKPSAGGSFDISPDAVNGQTGFKQFGKIDLSQGDVLNFLYSYVTQRKVNVSWNEANGTHSGYLDKPDQGTINTFVALVNSGVNINGIVNALQSAGGPLKTDGNMVFISPNGLVVGASGVLNVGNLSVLTPTQDSYSGLTKYLNLPQKQEGMINGIKITENDPVTQGKYTLDLTYDDNVKVTQMTDRTINPSALKVGNGTIDIQGNVAARGDINLVGGQVNVGGLLLAGLGNNHTEALAGHDAANTLFSNLVNTDNMGVGNKFINNAGKITISSNQGFYSNQNSKIRNYGTGNISINNTGINGVKIAGELSNPNGKLVVKNTGGELLVDTTGVVKSGGAALRVNNSSLLFDNSGSQGMNIKGKVNIDHSTKNGSVQFMNKNSNMSIGDNSINNNITSNADVNINVDRKSVV